MQILQAAGPDGVGPRALKACAPELCGILQHIFNLSLQLDRPPVGRETWCLDRKYILSKLFSILDNPSHPVHCVLAAQRRLITVKFSTEQHRRSFLPVDIKLFNSTPFCKKEGDLKV
ncbi:hypothetical protein EXN66_Car014119 [Channa argus]|uniref:Uncharacterized protein n=1 Tax=Channa argus TaxID=215402 RepID=A0A6G1Q838_CHAAH|nr:hypothetical protein EXN66_Car014119 [Channa argus]